MVRASRVPFRLRLHHTRLVVRLAVALDEGEISLTEWDQARKVGALACHYLGDGHLLVLL